jgi:hypothetical protein
VCVSARACVCVRVYVCEFAAKPEMRHAHSSVEADRRTMRIWLVQNFYSVRKSRNSCQRKYFFFSCYITSFITPKSKFIRAQIHYFAHSILNSS